eukprot:669362-Pelagomonas_calceolata.AAC.1
MSVLNHPQCKYWLLVFVFGRTGVNVPPVGPQPNGIGLPHMLQQQQQQQHHGFGGKHDMNRLMREDELLAMFAKILPHSPQQALIISQELHASSLVLAGSSE